MIVWWKEFTSYQSAQLDKWVTCAHCGHDYMYTLSRRVFGVGRSPFSLDNQGAANKAVERAGANLRWTLENDEDARPCPHCTRFQPSMLPAARRSYLPGMGFLQCLSLMGGIMMIGFVLLILNGIVRDAGPVVAWTVVFYLFGGLLAFVAVLPFLRLVLASLYDPNRDDPETRAKRGFFPGVTRAEFERTRAEQLEINRSLSDRARRVRETIRMEKLPPACIAYEQLLVNYLEPPPLDSPPVQAALKEALRAVVAYARLLERVDYESRRQLHREVAFVLNGICMTRFNESVYVF